MQNPFNTTDYLDEARSRVTEQFKDKDIFDRYLQLLISEAVILQDQMMGLMQLRSIDTAVGAQLDIIGEIVGRPRGLLTADQFKFFGFLTEPQAGSFGSLTDPQAGSTFYSLGVTKAGGRVPTDEEYRLLIKAKIIKNTTKSTTEDTINAFKFLFSAGQAFIDEYEPAKVRIGIGKLLTPTEKGLLFEFQGAGSLLPKTVGVNYEFLEFQSTRVFATEGFPGAYGAGDLNDPSVGGFLANLVD
jgi:hypothetical protein